MPVMWERHRVIVYLDSQQHHLGAVLRRHYIERPRIGCALPSKSRDRSKAPARLLL